MKEGPHSLWKARARNRNGAPGKAKKLMDILENDLRFSVNHPYFEVPAAEKMERIKRLDLLSSVVEIIREELNRP